LRFIFRYRYFHSCFGLSLTSKKFSIGVYEQRADRYRKYGIRKERIYLLKFGMNVDVIEAVAGPHW